ncbi:hypothetical protein ACOME3_007040 [Neoechinorhynchus agilis]
MISSRNYPIGVRTFSRNIEINAFFLIVEHLQENQWRIWNIYGYAYSRTECTKTRKNSFICVINLIFSVENETIFVTFAGFVKYSCWSVQTPRSMSSTKY